MSDVATDAFRQILSRVPAESLPRLRRVCKRWRRLIDDPAFLRLHFRRQSEQGDHLIIYGETKGWRKLSSVYLSSVNYLGCSRKTFQAATNVKNLFSLHGVPPVIDMPVPSCHGLMLLCQFDITKCWSVWNPFTKEVFRLPPYDHLTSRKLIPCKGIGYDAVSDDYKVVRVSGGLISTVLETLVYSFRSNTWRMIEDCPCIVGVIRCDYGVLFNGVLHWFIRIKQEGGEVVGKILAFDLATEKYHQIPVPPASFGSKHPLETYVEAFGECLFLTFTYRHQFDIWLLKDQGGENVWQKIFSIKLEETVCLVNPRLISYSKTKHRVVIRVGDDIWWFDVEKKCGTRVPLWGFNSNFSCQAFPLSLIRLNGSSSRVHETTASEGTLKRKRTSPDDRCTPFDMPAAFLSDLDAFLPYLKSSTPDSVATSLERTINSLPVTAATKFFNVCMLAASTNIRVVNEYLEIPANSGLARYINTHWVLKGRVDFSALNMAGHCMLCALGDIRSEFVRTFRKIIGGKSIWDVDLDNSGCTDEQKKIYKEKVSQVGKADADNAGNRMHYALASHSNTMLG